MSEMIERVARAVECAVADLDLRNGNLKWTDVAKAAIEAMREPTEAMRRVGADIAGNSEDGAAIIWQAMIDAALDNPKEP